MLERIGRTEWPKEHQNELAKHPNRRRVPVPMEELVERVQDKNEKLRDLHMEPLQPVEIVASRLYTGPMYCKYNTVLRDIGHLINKDLIRNTQSAKEISEALKSHQQQKWADVMGKREKQRPEHVAGHTEGNLYTVRADAAHLPRVRRALAGAAATAGGGTALRERCGAASSRASHDLLLHALALCSLPCGRRHFTSSTPPCSSFLSSRRPGWSTAGYLT
jgi:hypothetical protein